MGVRLHATIDFFGLKREGEVYGLVALIKQKGAEAQVENSPALVSGSRTIQPIVRTDRLGVIVAAENREAAQQKFQRLYAWLNTYGPPDNEIIKTRVFDGNSYCEVI